MKLVIDSATKRQLDAYRNAPTQVLILAAPAGSGKLTLAKYIAESILELPEGGLESYGQHLHIAPVDGKAIGIEAARQLEQFLRLKVPGTKRYDRVIIVESSHLMTTEAQNALLKTLEEPPEGTIIIMTADHELALLPTVRSRAQTISVQRPSKQLIDDYFSAKGFDRASVSRAYSLSGSLIGLMHALLEEDAHPLATAADQAKQLLSQTPYERLIAVETLAKDRSLAIDTVHVLQKMARISLQTATGRTAQRWQAIMEAAYNASEALAANAQPKLVLSRLVLQF